MYTVKNEQFEGPLDLLLTLIEKEQMDITQISLAKITGSYLEMIGEMKGDSSDLADFLVVAAKLLYIKSRDLIPNLANEEEEAEIEDLESRLREYQQFKNAAKHLELVLTYENRGYSRRAKNDNMISFTPPSSLGDNGLFAIFQEILSKTSQEKPVSAEIKQEPKITIDDKRIHITKHLSKNSRISFRKILNQASTRIEIIVTFLAILEMVKQKEISVTQDDNFADFFIMSVK